MMAHKAIYVKRSNRTKTIPVMIHISVSEAEFAIHLLRPHERVEAVTEQLSQFIKEVKAQS